VSPPVVVPAPVLTFEDAGGGAAALEKPVTVTFAAVTRDGVPLGPADLTAPGFVVTRRIAAGAAVQVWDDAAKAWVADAPGSPVVPLALAYQPGATPWHALLVAAGTSDAAGGAAFGSAVGGYPVYAVRGAFTAKDGTVAAGPAGPNLTFVSAAARNLTVMGPGDDEKPENATLSRLLLKDPGLRVIGGVTVSRSTPGAVVTVDNAAGASVVLYADGSVEVRPGPGRSITLAGDVETERITYLPAGGGPKRTLT
jgi:hypothetical protein